MGVLLIGRSRDGLNVASSGAAGEPSGFALLLEDGDTLLLEDDDRLLLED